MRIHRPIEYVSEPFYSQDCSLRKDELPSPARISRNGITNPDTLRGRKSFCERYQEVYCPRCLVDCDRRRKVN